MVISMNTTIQVDVKTKMILERFKKAHNAKTYDEAIKKLVKKKTPSLYGSLAGTKKRSMDEIRDTLRCEDDRV